MTQAHELHGNIVASHSFTVISLSNKKQLITLAILFACSCSIYSCHSKSPTLFQLIPANQSNIHFNNRISENDSINPIDMEFLYNGGGVAIADLNNDNLPDIFFTGSQVPNQLYVNKGNLQFVDATKIAQVAGDQKWFNGAAIIDINNDGKKDIYLCATVYNDANRRANILYVNQGNDPNGMPIFADKAKEFGLADTSFSVQAAFLDYDKDGDLDMYLVTTKLTNRSIFTFGSNKDSSSTDEDKLFRNDWDATKKHAFFTDVSKQAGIVGKGYGLGISVGDLNQDGWPDMYVTNDFITSDHLWINNRNGTFNNQVNACLKHTSQNAMGNDMVDVNNDGQVDLITMDMNPEDNYRRQKNMAGTNYAKYRNMLDKGYAIQYVRNTLQINQGPAWKSMDSLTLPFFAELGYYAGVAATDWSWTPSVADFDNDGKRDIFITNGYPKDVTDHDYISYRKDNGYMMPRMELVKQIPEIKIANYAYRNKGQVQFENVTKAWGLDLPAYSTGAAYADLDNDGDLDYVVNNTNDEAFLYANQTNTIEKKQTHFLRVQLLGDSLNRDAIGTKITAWFANEPHVYTHFPWRGYLSTVEWFAHFGLASLQQVDSLFVQWPNGKDQFLKNVQADLVLSLHMDDALAHDTSRKTTMPYEPLFAPSDLRYQFQWRHVESDYVDFDIQRLLPHKLSAYGPAMAVGDVDGNGTADIYMSGPKGIAGTWMLQSLNGNFTAKKWQENVHPNKKTWEEMGSLLLDVDGDLDLDLLICSGSNEAKQGDAAFVDHLFVNDGKGNFKEQMNALPDLRLSKDVLKAADWDADGDLDLFVGSRLIPAKYPQPANGFIWRNDSQNGEIHFTDVTKEMAPALQNIGMLTDALWTDFDNDDAVDLVLCGEMMSIQFLKNVKGKLVLQTNALQNQKGMWNSLLATDLDNDGDMDYVAGNMGLNSFYKGSTTEPFEVYAADFDNNGSFDAIPFLFLPDINGERKKYPCFTRDDMMKQMIRIKNDFPTYKDFAVASIENILRATEIKNALHTSANQFASCWLRNNGKGQFEMIALPFMAQWSSVFGMVADDFNADGNVDLLLCGNDYGTETATGANDAMNGLLLQGNGKGNFAPLSMLASGFCLPYDAKALVKINVHGRYGIVGSQNKNGAHLFCLQKATNLFALSARETNAIVHLQNGQNRKEEFYWGSSFLAQSGRFVQLNAAVKGVDIRNNKGETRSITNIQIK